MATVSGDRDVSGIGATSETRIDRMLASRRQAMGYKRKPTSGLGGMLARAYQNHSINGALDRLSSDDDNNSDTGDSDFD